MRDVVNDRDEYHELFLFFVFCSRGFIPKYCLVNVDNQNTAVIALTLSPKLFLKIAIENDFPLVSQDESIPSHAYRIYSKSFDILKRISVLNINAMFLMHDPHKLTAIATATSEEKSIPLQKVNEYFGSAVALYFGWLRYYTSCLYIPAAVGAVLYAVQLYNGEVLRAEALNQTVDIHRIISIYRWITCGEFLVTHY